MNLRTRFSAKKFTALTSVAAATLLMQACATSGLATKTSDAKASNQSAAQSLDPVAAAAFWGTRYDREPQNAEAAVNYSAALRKIGSYDEALKVMSKASGTHASNTAVSFEFGKTLIEANRAFEAIRHIELALTEQPENWRILSAYGVALDQIGEHDVARQHYDRALELAPGTISILNNKGLSYALSGDLDLARRTLVIATGDRRADSKVRQNLALVMALRGDLQSAERLARSDLPPQLADQNVEYFRNLLNQPAYWQDLAQSDVDTPSFDNVPSFDEVPQTATQTQVVPDVTVDVEEDPLPAVDTSPVLPSIDPAPSLTVPEQNQEEETPPEADGVPLVLGPVTAPSAVSFENDDADEDTSQN